MATGDLHKNISEDLSSGSRDMLADRQTDTQTDEQTKLSQSLAPRPVRSK